MKKLFILVWLFVSVSSIAQPLRDINYEYEYDPDAAVSFKVKYLRADASFTILYDLQVKDTVDLMNQYSLQWEGRDMLSDKEGKEISLADDSRIRNALGFEGRGTLPLAGAPKFIVARIIKNTEKRAWLFYISLEPNHPVNNFLMKGRQIVHEPFIHTNDEIKLAYDADEWIVSYYDDNFPPAAPGFSETQTKVSAIMTVDSTFRVRGGEDIGFSRKGLYLVQKDTTSLQGLALRAEEDYPQYSKLVNLPDPLVYISTRQEHDRLESSRGNKKAFDRIILSLTEDTGRARLLMRNYFRRVELANRYFTSYKEGWKTDRGMIYIIFGKPDQVFKFDDRQVWNYKDQFNIRFNFTRSASVFDPDNFVLIREKKYEQTWYEVIDLWRNARF